MTWELYFKGGKLRKTGLCVDLRVHTHTLPSMCVMNDLPFVVNYTNTLSTYLHVPGQELHLH